MIFSRARAPIGCTVSTARRLAVLAEVGVSRADLDRALATLERSEGIRIRSVVGLNHDAVFGSTREGWRADLPDLQGAVHPAALAQNPGAARPRAPGQHRPFLEDGTLPGLIGPDLQHLRRCGQASRRLFLRSFARHHPASPARRSIPANA